ncbi:hypothetical protein E1B28_010464 [Marasmius oreades]|uniref:F-box domain-containing protein n=1 Tax=Marasmius oreades TaxID=181124 RepID=A0A9P7URI3_9AGAR|nr:uncharacterized protein E1B28_010464 [Marasmius oreades]KAG7091428.1 hypothetical protein E1B28_010464 [Marasmius oreades]
MDNSTEAQPNFAAPVIPGELNDIIIDYCRDDTPSLITCSLVCRSWLFRSRHQLFNKSQIQNRFIDANGAATFTDILRSPHCTIIPHIISLQLRGQSTSEPCPTWIEELWKTCNSLPSLKLQSFSLEDVSIDLLPKLIPINSKTSLTSLSLHCCDGIGRTSSTNIVLRMCEFLNNFEALEELTLEYYSAGRVISFLPPSPNIIGSRLRLPNVRRIALDSAFKVFLPLFSKPGFIDAPSLTQIHLRLPMSIEDRLLQSFFDIVCAPSVQVLEISIRYRFTTLEIFFPTINLVKLKHLRSIMFEIGEVTVFQDNRHLRNAVIVDGVSVILSRLRGVDRSVTQISFGTQFPFAPPEGLPQDIEWLDLDGLREGLNDRRFSDTSVSLQTV